MKEELLKKVDLYLSIYHDLLAFLNMKYSDFSLDFFNQLLETFFNRIKNSQLENEEKEELLKLIQNLKEIKELNKRDKKFSEIIKFLKRKLKLNLEIIKILNNINFRYIVFNKRVLLKLKNKIYEEGIFLIKNLIYSDLKRVAREINKLLLEVKERNIVLIIRRDSLFVDYLIVEDILNLELINDFRIYEYYKKGLIKPKKEENEELEDLIINNKKRLINYIIEDSIDFVLKYLKY